jgi:predicted ATPase
MSLRLTVQNLAALRRVVWAVHDGISVLVGPNGIGKSTLLSSFELLRHAFERSLPTAVEQMLGGAGAVRSFDAAPDAETFIEVALGGGALAWRVRVSLAGASVSAMPEETVIQDGRTILHREAGNQGYDFAGRGYNTQLTQLALHAVVASGHVLPHSSPEYSAILGLYNIIANYRLYRSYGFRLWDIPRSGSQHGSDRHLDPRGEQVFTVLRNWSLQRDPRPRFQFVVDGLREVFPEFEEFDFEQAGTTVTVAVHRSGGRKLPIAQESTGFLVAMLHLTAIASAEPGSVVAIDQIEDSLHPEMIRCLLRLARRWASRHHLRVLLATHSPVVLDDMRDEPDHVFVMQPGEPTLPVRVDEMFDPGWLAQFSLGSLYTGRDFGAPVPHAAAE